MKKLRGAIAGFGKVAVEAHLPGFAHSPGFEIVAIVDPAAESREVAAKLLPEARVFESLPDLLAGGSKVDFVDVAATPRAHAGLATEGLDRGLHVLCEKPLAVRTAELAELRRAVRTSGRALFTVHNWKYAPLFRRLKGLLVAGVIGEPHDIEWNVLRPNPPSGAVASEASWRLDPERAGGGVLMDHGWHAFYLMLYLTGRTPHSVIATLRNERGLAVEDNCETTVEFAGCVARIRLSWTAAERRCFGRITGPLGVIEVDDDSLVVRVPGGSTLPGRGDASPPLDDRGSTPSGDALRFAPPLSASSWHPEWFPPLLDEFRDEVLHPERRGRNFAEAVLCAELVSAAYASHGDPVLLPTESGQASNREVTIRRGIPSEGGS